jgi:Ca2+-binding EF-hand superfamily protein
MAKLSEEQVAELKQAFAAMDTNGDGQVTKEELKALLSQLGESVDDAVIDEMIKIADVNGDGKVDFNEFVKAATE